MVDAVVAITSTTLCHHHISEINLHPIVSDIPDMDDDNQEPVGRPFGNFRPVHRTQDTLRRRFEVQECRNVGVNRHVGYAATPDPPSWLGDS